MDSDSDQRDQNVIVVTARSHVPGDPLQGVNIKSFEVTQAVDRALVRPVALTYQRIVPDPLRSGFRNFLNNLREPVAFLNFLLQIKPGKAAETAGRFAINSTIGAAGLFDFARRRPFKLPRRPNGFANTLGYYGVKPGPFLYLPLIGPTTLRDFLGDGLDRLFLPVVVGRPFSRPVYAISVGTLSSLDQRAEFDEKLQVLHADSVDPYAATRQDYLHHRQDVIDALHGRPAPDRSDADVAPPALPVPAVPLPQH
jgi:phospholipid-binding lipoprotein MlaA